MTKEFNIALLTSTSLRHCFMANKLSEEFNLKLIVQEEKGNESQYVGKNEEDTEQLQKHFNSLKQSEARFFSDKSSWPNGSNRVSVKRGQLNTVDILNILKESQIDAIAVFGCGIIGKEIIKEFKGRLINSHQGISPFYRGSATNFWPFVNNEIQYIGVTMHFIDEGIDTGNIICHAQPPIDSDDTMHDIGCKVIIETARLYCEIFNHLKVGNQIKQFSQETKGKLYQRKDFNAEVVRIANNNIKNGVIKHFIENKSLHDSEFIVPLSIIK